MEAGAPPPISYNQVMAGTAAAARCVNTSVLSKEEWSGKWIGLAGDIRNNPEGPMVGMVDPGKDFVEGWQK